MPSPQQTDRPAAGVAYAAAAYLWWGLFPLYFRALAGVPATEILAHRILWSAAFLTVLVTVRRSWPVVLQQLRAAGALRTLAATAVFISSNWLIYIWAVNSGRVLEASLGYFVNPLVTVVFGVLFLRDRLTPRQVLAIALAAAGVVALVVRAGQVPWVAMTLAVTFALYGLLRKRVRIDAVSGLLGEVGILAPVALLYVASLQRSGAGHFGAGARQSVLLATSGVVTALPLIWFAKGVERLRLSTIGLLQYLNPSFQFAIAVFAFGERFTPAHAMAFGCIWISLAIYTAEALALTRRPRASLESS
jgi:chloramphenicol-sensitive protein RarD